MHARAGIDLGLAIQRQVIVVLGHHHLRQQPRRRDALVDDLCRHRRGLDRLAARAGVLAANVAQHEELRRHAVELLADLLTNALERFAAGAVGGLDLVVALDARQARGQRLAHGLALGTRRGRRRDLVPGRLILERGVGHDGVEQHGLRRVVQALAGLAEAPALQARDLEVQRLVPGLLEPELDLHALDQSAKFVHRVGCRHRVVRGIGRCAAGFEHGWQYPSRACAREAGHSPMDK